MMLIHPNTAPTWGDIFEHEADKPYFRELVAEIERQRSSGVEVDPKSADVFKAFELTPFDSIRVVIIGQDPYHGAGQAHGLCFSVEPPTPPPPSLQNIFNELKRDPKVNRKLEVSSIRTGSLRGWAEQGVLLLNAVLTVKAHEAGSHAGMGWERFTDYIIERINAEHFGVVFLLWGAYARKKASVVDRSRNLVLEAPHPSPLSAYRGFIGCGHFSQANDYLIKTGNQGIDWFKS